MGSLASNIKIAIDAGHGSNTAGKRTPPMPEDIDFDQDGIVDIKKNESIREHIANVGVSVLLAKELRRCGFQVFQSAWDDDNAYDDEDVDLTTRQNLIKKAGCQYSVSIHFNAFGDGKTFNSANGICTYYHSNDARINDSRRLAAIVQNHLSKGTKQRNRGTNRGAFAMVNCANMNTKASILVELAFMTNLEEATKMMGNSTFWKECAVEICKGFCEYLKTDYVEEVIEKKEKTSASAAKVLYQVQAGAYSVMDNAVKQKEKVIKAGYKSAYISTNKTSNKRLYLVIVGAFGVKSNADGVVKQLAKRNIVAIITRKY